MRRLCRAADHQAHRRVARGAGGRGNWHTTAGVDAPTPPTGGAGGGRGRGRRAGHAPVTGECNTGVGSGDGRCVEVCRAPALQHCLGYGKGRRGGLHVPADCGRGGPRTPRCLAARQAQWPGSGGRKPQGEGNGGGGGRRCGARVGLCRGRPRQKEKKRNPGLVKAGAPFFLAGSTMAKAPVRPINEGDPPEGLY